MDDNHQPIDKSELLKNLTGRFSKEELKILSFQLGVDWDELAGTAKTAKAQELIAHLDRRGRLDELVAAAAKARPHANWPSVPAATELLQTMPLDHVPAVAPLPPGSRLPLLRNPLFVGRKADLIAVARAACFVPGEPIPRPLLLATLALPDEELEARLLAEDGLRRLNQAGYPAPLLAWQPHLRAVTDAAAAREDERAAALCNTLGFHLEMIGDYEGARPYFERALAIRLSASIRCHPCSFLFLYSERGRILGRVIILFGSRLFQSFADPAIQALVRQACFQGDSAM